MYPGLERLDIWWFDLGYSPVFSEKVATCARPHVLKCGVITWEGVTEGILGQRAPRPP